MPVDLIVILLIVLAVVLIWRGPKTLPQWGTAIGKAVRGAREEAAKAQTGIEQRLDGPEPPSEDDPQRRD
jgi:Sec-independent protein translocase protein TatA